MDCWSPTAERCTCHLLASQVSYFTRWLFLIVLAGVKSKCHTESSNPNLLFLSLSFCYQLPDEPRLDGQDQDAAGEKVCITLALIKDTHCVLCTQKLLGCHVCI